MLYSNQIAIGTRFLYYAILGPAYNLFIRGAHCQALSIPFSGYLHQGKVEGQTLDIYKLTDRA